MIELSAPPVLRTQRPEHFNVEGFTCPECSGNGWHWKGDGKDYEKDPCRVCNGTGRVDAVVTIHWKASERRAKL